MRIQWLKRVPVAGPLARRVLTIKRKRDDQNTLARLRRVAHPRALPIHQSIAQLTATLSPEDRRWIDAIEGERARLSRCDEPLVDETLGPGGPYDAGLSVAKACEASKPPTPALMLYLLTRALAPRNVLELGTNVGISSSCIAAGQAAAGVAGRLTTMDASVYRQAQAKAVHQRLKLDRVDYVPGLFADTLEATLKRLGPLDLAFIDGHHQYQPTIDYFEAILPHATPDCVFVFDDIRWSDGMKRAWSELKSDARFGLVVDLDSVGVCARALGGAHEHTVLPRLRSVFGRT